MNKIFKNQIRKRENFIASTSPMYEALFGEDSNDACLAEDKPDAEHISIEVFVRDCDGEEPCDEDNDTPIEDKPRSLDEMYAAIETLRKQVWYNSHMNLCWQIDEGEVEVVSSAEWRENKYNELRYPERQNYIHEEIWDAAQKNAKKVEDELGEDNLGPWTDVEWGMLTGKLSALRWGVGNDWDFLDT